MAKECTQGNDCVDISDKLEKASKKLDYFYNNIHIGTSKVSDFNKIEVFIPTSMSVDEYYDAISKLVDDIKKKHYVPKYKNVLVFDKETEDKMIAMYCEAMKEIIKKAQQKMGLTIKEEENDILA